jgi:Protein of unknown function (DUF4435)
MNFKHRLEDIVVRAIMLDEPVVVVEGRDDRQIYQKMAHQIAKKLKVHPIDAFEDYHAGCESVIKAIYQLQSKFLEDSNYTKFLLGIIDRDSRPYKSLKPDEIDWRVLKGLFVLKYYSIETYFATPFNIVRLIEKWTYATQNDVNEAIINFILYNVNDSIEGLYYISLDALKQECLGADEYKAVLSYAQDEGSKVTEENSRNYLIQRIYNTKKADLDNFAIEKGLTIEDIRFIARGKWFLYNFVYRALNHIQKIHGKFLAGEFVKLYYGDIFKMKNELSPKEFTKIAYHDILNLIDEKECADIILKINGLG